MNLYLDLKFERKEEELYREGKWLQSIHNKIKLKKGLSDLQTLWQTEQETRSQIYRQAR